NQRSGAILMALTLPELPYAYDALGPYMSKETLEFHHDKHHQAYVTNANKLGQHYNHTHFWNWMKPGGGGGASKVPAALAKAIDRDLGGFDKFRTDFI